jgi:predicted NACHT family NTPase
VVLLGDPGSGKSTFVNHLAHCLALHLQEPKANWLKHLPGWTETDTLPIVVILRDFARGLPDPLPRHLFANGYHQPLDKFP